MLPLVIFTIILTIFTNNARSNLLSVNLQYNGLLYTADVSIQGSPKRHNLAVVIETPDTWVLTTECLDGSFCADLKKNKYPVTFVINSRRNESISIDSGFAHVNVFKRLKNIEIAGAYMVAQDIGLATSVTTKTHKGIVVDFNTHNVDGVLGLGMNYEVDLGKPILYTMFDQQFINKKLFSIKFNNNPQLIFGINENLYKGDITYTDIIDTKTYKFKIDSLIVGDEKWPWATNFHASVGSLSTSIFVPRYIYYRFGNKTEGINCTQVPDWTFTIAEREFKLTRNDILLWVQDDCYDNTEVLLSDEWILGMPFLKKYYTIYDIDNMKIGFAENIEN